MAFDQIKRYMNVFSQEEIDKIFSFLSEPKWCYGHSSTLETKHKSFWRMELSDNPYFSEHLYEKVKKITGLQNLKTERIYVNGQTYGLDGYFHTDCMEGVTFLYYVNTVWYPIWKGNTIFFDPNSKTDNMKYFYPHPNSAILFPGNILHYGESPSRDCYELRLTLAFKFYSK